jgi:hypothetical protein
LAGQPGRLNEVDVMTGLVRALADRGVTSFPAGSGEPDAAFLAVYETLHGGLAYTYGLEVRFMIAPDDFGISETCQVALASAVDSRLLRHEGRSFLLDPEAVKRLVSYSSLPGSEAVYRQLVDVFIGGLKAAAA